MKTEVFGHDWISMDLPFPYEIHTYIPYPSVLPNAKKVLLICSEPRPGMVINDWIRKHYIEFGLIITYDHDIADLPNVVIQYFGGAFSDERPAKKRFAHSFLFSTGNSSPLYAGYNKRKEIASNFGATNIPGEIYLCSKRLNITEEEKQSIYSSATARNYEVYIAGNTKNAGDGMHVSHRD
jgi:hypothetical protein